MKILLRILGIALCVLPPAISTLEFFPLWLSDGKSALSALSLMLLLLSALPLFRIVKRHLRSPSLWMLWLILWGVLEVFLPILSAVKTIALVSFPTGLLGALFFRLAKRSEAKAQTEV